MANWAILFKGQLQQLLSRIGHIISAKDKAVPKLARRKIAKAASKKAAPKALKATKAPKAPEAAMMAASKQSISALLRSKRIARRRAIEDKRDIQLARAALAEAKRKGTVPWDEVKTRLGL